MRHLRRISRQRPAVAQVPLDSKIVLLASHVAQVIAQAIAIPVPIDKPPADL